ncbi:histone-lysine n-methyltransferase PRDM9 [Fusarium globosum]|uniref:Histone-lysine n-methyltransferase PRDM9 n=1 Tax=Fusarium globosum TaxID=78864 RepID=A0A8H6DFE9_9HYPO|nr:histone-lysine n-methyltransferase PRDM9 [Fusarium globosum]
MTRANLRVKVEDQAAYRVALKQRTTYSAPNPALQQYQHTNGLNCSELAGQVPRQLQFAGHGEDVPGAGSVEAQNIERTFAMVEEQMFMLTAC